MEQLFCFSKIEENLPNGGDDFLIRPHVAILERKLLESRLQTISVQEDYTDLIEDVLDE